MRTLQRLVATAILLAVSTNAEAQLVSSTGAVTAAGRDLRWEISADNGASWISAFVVQNPPAPWSVAPGVWVGLTGSGSSEGGGSYRIRTSFALAAGDVAEISLRCAVDNTFTSMLINGTVFGSNNCTGNGSFAFGPTQNLTTANFMTGTNVIEFRWTGDATTDGINVDVLSQRFVPGTQTVVPEPTSVVLLAMGLLSLGAITRRRRAS